MAKKKRATRPTPKKTQPSAKRRKWSASRSRTVRPNGALPESLQSAPEPEDKIPVGEAMRRAVEALGEVIVDDSLAPQQMKELGACYEEVTRRQAAFDARAEEAKTAKKSLESAQELLLEKVRSFTHPAPLPLFDHAEREADQQTMEAAAGAEELGVGEAVQ